MPSLRDATYYRKWYEVNKDKRNAKRRHKYASDPEVKERALGYQAAYRSRVVRVSTKGQPQYRAPSIPGILDNVPPQRVFRIAQAASMIGCSIEFIRKHEASGSIPETIFPSFHRYYTHNQINLLRTFYEALSSLKYSRDKELKTRTLKALQDDLRSGWARLEATPTEITPT